MRIFRYEYFLILLAIILMVFLSLSFFFASKEWSFARSYGSLVQPVDWFKYYSELEIRKTYSKIFLNNKNGLPTIHLFVPEKNLDKLLSKTPQSTKNWQNGFIYENKKKKKIKIRYLGDNFNNWIFENKSLKLKYSKKNFGSEFRSYDYFTTGEPSESNFNFTKKISHFLLKEFGLLAPDVKMVEIRINGEHKGIYFQMPKQDEIFLRKNNFMPVNIYKGENSNIESKIGIDKNLFNNPYLWSKISVFNQTDIKNKDDLTYFFQLLKDFNNNTISPNFFFSKIPADIWAKFLISGASEHGSNIQNQRLLSDPWSGQYHPLPVDSVFDLNGFLDHNLERNMFNYRDMTLNADPYFVFLKYKKYYEYIFEQKLLISFANSLEELKPKLLNSAKRDYHFIRGIYEGNIKRKNVDLFNNNNGLENEINKLIINLKKATNNEKNYFIKDINATWLTKDNYLFITLKDKLPSGDILLKLKEGHNLEDLTIKLTNENKFFQNQIIPYDIIDNKTLRLKISLVADRVVYLESQPVRYLSKIKPTLFKFKFNKNLKIDNIKVFNIFSNNFQQIKFSKKKGLRASINNYALVNKQNDVTELTGDIYLNETKIFNKKVLIKPGTKFFLKKGVSLVFKNQLIANGTKTSPIIIKQFNINEYWGSILLIGNETRLSKLNNIIIEGGSGGWIENIKSTGMLSIHNSENITLKNINLSNNNIYDDMLHIVYSNDVIIKNLKMSKIYSDGIDIDISKNIEIDNIVITSAKNDCLDFMQTSAVIKNSLFKNCNDKGISVGENSNIFISASNFLKNNIAIESKDRSIVNVKISQFTSNKLVFSAYKKNWKYNGGGIIQSKDNLILNNLKNLSKDKFSSITIN